MVDGEALLRSGLGWALDVWEHEPHLDPALLENALLATPHIAGYSEQGKANATAMSVASLARRFGLPLEGWYPPQAAPARRRPISWQELCRTIGAANIFSTNGADCARSGVRKRRNLLFISEFALF